MKKYIDQFGFERHISDHVRTHAQRIQMIKVVVCNQCLRASCWQGVWLCEASWKAGVVHKTIGELKSKKAEAPSYWKNTLA
jgi:hypothetical protein